MLTSRHGKGARQRGAFPSSGNGRSTVYAWTGRGSGAVSVTKMVKKRESGGNPRPRPRRPPSSPPGIVVPATGTTPQRHRRGFLGIQDSPRSRSSHQYIVTEPDPALARGGEPRATPSTPPASMRRQVVFREQGKGWILGP